ncbi:hypothetical protein, conserved in T. vivax [Trypanosoma vivax Y486]|uniref:Uncharacterized protein n=1 Tax=Trypanosoma vivax (strain Y486) TaxID=1055687 RepID=F9WS71_TRYVY|nr:hypothetical protein, conserved in T. vivax [Trypanosoma vivax Y486]|eukprot:CCD20409.1 hypothetical protein, conserved in T. vivax [Trypanosoma vivax Y486]
MRPVTARGPCLLYVAARLRAFATLWARGRGEDWLSVRGFGCVGACEALAAVAHGMAGTACSFFFLLFRVWRRFSARGAFARMELTRGAWLLALVLLAAATGEAAISSKAGVTDTDAGLLCVVSGALKGGARQAQVDTERAFTLMSAIAAHRAGPDVAKGAKPALAKMSARTKQETVAQTQRATHALASLERRKARAAALAQAIATRATEAATLSAHIAGEMDQWTRIASTLVSKAESGFPCITSDPTTHAGTITLTSNLVEANEAQSGTGTAKGAPVPAECDDDPTEEMKAIAWANVTSAIATAEGGILNEFEIGTPTSGSQDSCPLTSVAGAGSAGSYRDWRMAGVFNVRLSNSLMGKTFTENVERVAALAKQLNTLTQEPEDGDEEEDPADKCLAGHDDSEPYTIDQKPPSNWRDACIWCGANLCSAKQSEKIQSALAKLSLLAADSSATSETQSEPQAGAQRQSDDNAEQDQGSSEATALGGAQGQESNTQQRARSDKDTQAASEATRATHSTTLATLAALTAAL